MTLTSTAEHDSVGVRTRTNERSLRSLVGDTATLTNRLLRRWTRDPATTAETVLVPVAFLVTLNIVLGDGIARFSGHSALYGSVPLVAMVAATQGATVGGLGLMRERDDGLLARLWVLPINRAAGFIARIAAEAARIVLATAALMITGLILGMRFHEGILAAICWLFVPCIFGLAFFIGVAAVALYAAKAIVVEATALVSGLFMFFSTGFVPLEAYPEWIRPAVEHQPLSYTVDVMRGLSMGGPVLAPFVGLVTWSAIIAGVCLVPAILGYRRASMRE